MIYEYVPDLIPVDTKLVDHLWDTLAWEKRDAPRREYFCTRIGAPYTYGRGAGQRTYYPNPITFEIELLWGIVEKECATRFEVVFLNGYKDEKDHLGWHADDSPEMNDNRPIAVVSLGAERQIWLRPNTGGEATDKVLLQNGSLFIMPPGFQDKYQHRIPKGDRPCGKRISFTFRGYVK